MPLRPELQAPTPDPAVVSRLAELCVEGVRRCDSGQDCADIIEQVHAVTGGERLTPADFDAIAGSMDERAWAEQEAMGDPPLVPDMTRDERIEIVTLLLASVGEPHTAYYLRLLDRNTPGASISDLIFWPEEHWPPGHQPTADEIVDKAMAALPDPK